jgi:hypothetical protein
MKSNFVAAAVAAGIVALSGASAAATENWLPLLDDPARAFAKGPVWAGDVTFVSISAACKSPTAFKVGDVRKGFFRPIPNGQFVPAGMIVFPDGVFLGIARSPTQFGAIAINKSAWMFTSPTNTNKMRLVLNPPNPTPTTQTVVVDATFNNYFYAVPNCAVRVRGTLQKQ